MDRTIFLFILTLSLIVPIDYVANTADAFPPENQTSTYDFKSFKDRNNLFTVEYPSGWIPFYTGESSKHGPIDIYFSSPGWTQTIGSNWAQVSFYQYDWKSAFNSPQEHLEAEITSNKNNPLLTKVQIEQPIECSRYILNGQPACSYIYQLSNKDQSWVTMAVVSMLSDGTVYETYYKADVDSFKKYFPIAEEMIKTFKTTGDTDLNMTNTTSSSDNEFSLN